jgi:hypothetical protein
LTKPTTTEGIEASLLRLKEFTQPHTKRLLVVEDNETERQSIIDLLAHGDIEIAGAGTGTEPSTCSSINRSTAWSLICVCLT